MYRRRLKISEKLQAAMQAGRERARIAGPIPEHPPRMPELRRRIIIEDFDFGRVTHTIELYRTNRIDCYRAVADGKLWRPRSTEFTSSPRENSGWYDLPVIRYLSVCF